MAFDHFEDTFDIIVHVHIRDSNDEKTAGLEGV
jgi:hypothetical protein